MTFIDDVDAASISPMVTSSSYQSTDPETGYLEFNIYGVNNTSLHKMVDWKLGLTDDTTYDIIMAFGNAAIRTTSAVTAFKVYPASGTLKVGTAYLYGRNKS